MDFDDLAPGNVETYAAIVLAQITEAERQREHAVEVATLFIYRVRELPDVQPQPPIFYRIANRVAALKVHEA